MKTRMYINLIPVILILIIFTGCNKTTYLDRQLQGTLNDVNYIFDAAYAVDAWLFPDESWTVLIYPKPVTVNVDSLDYRFDRIQTPNLSVTIEKDPEKNKYVFNFLGIAFGGKEGTILTGVINDKEDDDINFQKGNMEILERDLDNGVLYAKLWAKTRDGSSFISGNIKIKIRKSDSDDENLSEEE